MDPNSSINFIYFVFILFFILIRASIIDVKTMFVPLNIIFEIYTIAILSVLYFGNIISSVLGLLIGTIPLLFISFLFRKKVYEEIVLEEASTTKKYRPILYLIIIFLGLSIFNSNILNGIIFIVGLILIGLSTRYYKNPIELTFLLLGITSLLLLYDKALLGLVFAALLIEFFCFLAFKRFDDTEKLRSEEKEIMKNGGDVYGAIGFGDILIFGAIGLIVGVKFLMPVLFFSGIFHLIFTLIYFLYTGNKQKSIPFIPGIAFGLVYFFSQVDVFNLKALLFGFL